MQVCRITYFLICVIQSVNLHFRKLSLSTNMIEKIAGISSLKNLRILSLGRNYIKSLAGLVQI
jgi:dynein light chain 1